MSEQLLSTGDVAKRLGVSREYVRKLELAGKLNAVRTAGGVRIFKADEVEDLASQRASRTQEKDGQQRESTAVAG